MKSIEFDESQLGNLEQLASALFNDEGDPRSRTYNRILIRPKIHWFRIALHLLIPAAAAVLLFFVLRMLTAPTWLTICIPTVLVLVCIVLNLKKAAICLVEIYQRYAPDSVRKNCRFEPSCSNYMILAINKYGFWKGLCKGIGRLRRCNINNGGFDMP